MYLDKETYVTVLTVVCRGRSGGGNKVDFVKYSYNSLKKGWVTERDTDIV